MAVVNPVSGIQSSFNRAVNKFKPQQPLPNPVSRSFLFEVIDTTTKQIVESFTLVVPPTAVSVREPERVTITKTFGNIFVDDYGPDNLQIMIKGFSGTSHAWPTFRVSGTSSTVDASLQSYKAANDKAFSGYTHKTAFYEFRNSIMRYKYKYRDKLGDMKLRVYDLYDEQIYDCILMEFTCDRDASRPLYYPYSITLLASNLPDMDGDTRPKALMLGGPIDKLMENIDRAVTWFEAGFGFVSTIKGAVATIGNTVDLLAARLATFSSEITDVVESPLDITKQLIEMIGAFDVTVETAYANARLIEDSYLSAKETIHDMWHNTLALYHEAIAQGAQSTKTETLAIDLGLSIPTGDDLHVTSTDKAMGVAPATRAFRIDTKVFTGVNLYTVKGNDTLQSIALNEMGDSALWPYLASVNNLVDSTELHTKEQIYIPVQTPIGATNKDNFVVTENPVRDPYGTDIRLDDSSDLMLGESNDFALISGFGNIQQWVDTVFKTPIGSVIKHTALGLSAQPGLPGDDLAIRYLKLCLRIALKYNPRIQGIDNLVIVTDSDVVRVGGDVEVVGYDKTIPIEVAL